MKTLDNFLDPKMEKQNLVTSKAGACTTEELIRMMWYAATRSDSEATTWYNSGANACYNSLVNSNETTLFHCRLL
ncbi:MAG: hypothetical protein LBV41_09280 [Cytophagaceae bacterium]|jgi:hypothetical protein|nr:hypothetical protein [Cytophagaceae bacterium]